ncbi:MAG TPA: glutamyl-tRNA reductase [Terriglobia bacterium]|nr:glutamyl-tRNA reductase [Terriglobia bacterium]
MNLALVGINHRTAPVEVRERMNIPEARLEEAVADLAHRDGITEGLILSTCNRVEVIANAQNNVAAEPVIRRFLADHHHCDLAAYEPHFYRYRQQQVVEHLFRVASSLDSMIVGEPQILGQLKQAYNVARQAGALNGTLNEIVLQALTVARKVRRDTAIGASAVSVSYAAVELARKIFRDLTGTTIFVIGAGKMSEIAAKNLIRSGASAIFVSNRTYERATELAKAFHGTAIRFEELFDHVQKADIVICSTSAPHYVIHREHAEKWLAARKNRPIFFIDISVPRNVDPAINQLDNAFVYDIDDLGQVVEANKKQREREASWAEEIVQDEVQKAMRRMASREVVPTIVALEQRLEHIRESELERYRGRLNALSPQQREAVEALTKGILNKILHGPITELKSGAGRPEQSSLVQVVRKIFGVVE